MTRQIKSEENNVAWDQRMVSAVKEHDLGG